MRITPPRKVIRTDYFRTSLRQSTRAIVVRYTNTIADPRIDAVFIDGLDAAQGYFGATCHYLIRTSGHIETARDPRTLTSVGPLLVRHEAVVIAIVGGLDLDGNLTANHTAEQEAALEELMVEIATVLDTPLEVTDLREFLIRRAEEAREEIEEADDAVAANEAG